MALSATIYRLNLHISNMDTHFYEEFDLTLAKHPSENETRMMYRIIAFIHNAHEDLKFTKGLSSTEEPEIWNIGLTGEIEHWIELGLPEPKRIKQAIGKSKNVSIYSYHKSKAVDWLPKIIKQFKDNDKVSIFSIEVVENGPLENLVNKSMNLSCIIEDGLMHLSDDEHRIGIQLTKNL